MNERALSSRYPQPQDTSAFFSIGFFFFWLHVDQWTTPFLHLGSDLIPHTHTLSLPEPAVITVSRITRMYTSTVDLRLHHVFVFHFHAFVLHLASSCHFLSHICINLLLSFHSNVAPASIIFSFLHDQCALTDGFISYSIFFGRSLCFNIGPFASFFCIPSSPSLHAYT